MTNVRRGEEFPELAPGFRSSDVETEGLSPKALAAGFAPLGLGFALMILDLLKILDVDDTLWIALLGISPVAGGAASAAKVGKVRKKISRRSSWSRAWSRGRRKR